MHRQVYYQRTSHDTQTDTQKQPSIVKDIGVEIIGDTHCKQFSLPLSDSHTMDYVKIIISLILVVIFYLLFGRESIAKLKKGGISISRREEQPQNIKEPGNQHFCKSNMLLSNHFV